MDLKETKKKELWIKTCHDGNIHDILQFFSPYQRSKQDVTLPLYPLTFTSWIWTFWYLAWAHFWWEWI